MKQVYLNRLYAGIQNGHLKNNVCNIVNNVNFWLYLKMYNAGGKQAGAKRAYGLYVPLSKRTIAITYHFLD